MTNYELPAANNDLYIGNLVRRSNGDIIVGGARYELITYIISGLPQEGPGWKRIKNDMRLACMREIERAENEGHPIPEVVWVQYQRGIFSRPSWPE